ncbi:MAG: sialate O-acetylesterase [Alphaproteobacteria bacterium]|nr:sialate O-acetylesterase [Alphaproteobacteria bacterium]
MFDDRAEVSGAKGRLVVFAGQSNMLGHAKATDGGKPVNDRLLAWPGGAGCGAWRRAELGRAPFHEATGSPNNPALHFGNLLQRETGDTVFLVGRPINASTILSWSSAGASNMRKLIQEIDAAIARDEARDAGIKFVDSFVWLQGECDDERATMVLEPKVASLNAYRAEFGKMVRDLQGKPWWSAGRTKLICGELVQNGSLSARNDFYANRKLWPTECLMGAAPSKGLEDIGDGTHYTGSALEEMGGRMLKVWRELSAGPTASQEMRSVTTGRMEV